MKKISILLVVAMLFSLVLPVCGCGGSASSGELTKKVVKAKVTRTDGVEEELSSDELVAIYKENEAKFNKYYKGAKIEVTCTVKSVEDSDDIEYGSTVIHFFDGWTFTRRKWFGCLLRDYSPDVIYGTDIVISDLSEGDKIYIKGKIDAGNSFGIVLTAEFDDAEVYKVS